MHHKGAIYTGWTLGAGLEHALSDNWTVRAEYSFSDLGSKSFTWYQAPLTPAGPYNVQGQYHMDLKLHDFNVGIAYRF